MTEKSQPLSNTDRIRISLYKDPLMRCVGPQRLSILDGDYMCLCLCNVCFYFNVSNIRTCSITFSCLTVLLSLYIVSISFQFRSKTCSYSQKFSIQMTRINFFISINKLSVCANVTMTSSVWILLNLYFNVKSHNCLFTFC